MVRAAAVATASAAWGENCEHPVIASHPPHLPCSIWLHQETAVPPSAGPRRLRPEARQR